jgi:hypothetical protein
MEIEPRYVSCTIRRWQDYTGNKAVLENDGRTFDEVSQERMGAAV